MPSLSHTIRKFDRFELKYLVPLTVAEAFKNSLRAYLLPDDHGNSEGSYRLASLYYDGPDLRFYWEKVDGIKFRRKLRIRRYHAGGPLTGDSPVFCEIKQRVDRVTQKRRVLLTYREALRLCDEREVPAHDPRDAPVVDEILSMLWQYNLQPTSVIRYSRQAWVGTEYDIGLRVTFDNDLSYRVHPLEFDESQDGLPLFPADWTVVEIKVNERIPYWLTELVAVHNMNLVRVSKYCRSIDLAQNLGTPSARLVLV